MPSGKHQAHPNPVGLIYFENIIGVIPVPGVLPCMSQPKILLKIEAVLNRIPVSRSQIYTLIAEKKFPTPVHLGGRSSFWVESEINEWIQTHINTERQSA